MIYLDNAATTHTKPKGVIDAVNEALLNYSANPGRSGHKLSIETSEMVYNVRKQVADYFNADSFENVVFTQNCTTSLNIVIRGLFKRGNHILISDLEHNSVSRTAFAMQEKGVELDIFAVGKTAEETLNNIKLLLKPNTKGIICTHGSNVFGIVLPIEEIGLICKEKGLSFIVDAAQTAGILDIDVKRMNIDYLCVAPHKGLYAPMGTGLLITDNKPEPLISGGTGSNSALNTQPHFLPDKYESGTINVPGIAGIGAGIRFVNKYNDEIVKRENDIIRYLYKNLSNNKNIIIYNDCPELPVLSFNYKNVNSNDIANHLSSNNICVRAGLHCAPLAHKKFGTSATGTVRVSPSIFNSKSDADKLLFALSKY